MTAPAQAAGGGLWIGEVAQRLGVSERTLRYYEEIGLVEPSAHAHGRNRRYSETDVTRIEHVKRLQELCGLNLNEIRKVMAARDRLDAIDARACPGRGRERAGEAVALLTDLRDTVHGRVERMQGFLDDLDAKIARHRAMVDES